MSKRKLAGIIVGCIVVVIVIVVIATRPPAPPTQTYTLNININPSGAGSVSPSGGEYESGVQVTLTASPASDYSFDYWSGNASGTASTITITMDSDKSLTAHFETIPIYTLTTNVSPSGAGSVSPSSGEYESGAEVTLTASAATGYTFDYWGGAASGSMNIVTITMNSHKTITAHFKEESEPEIPTHFTTYTNELGLFSISYPPEWELAIEYIPGLEQNVEDVISSITSDLPLEEASLIFLAGLPTEIGYLPSVNIVVEPNPGWTHDEMVTAEIEGLKLVVSDYHEFSRVKTTIDNRTATIIEFQGNVAGLGTYHDVFMCCIVNKTIWGVTCTALPDEYSEWEDDFDAIVRSLRILK